MDKWIILFTEWFGDLDLRERRPLRHWLLSLVPGLALWGLVCGFAALWNASKLDVVAGAAVFFYIAAIVLFLPLQLVTFFWLDMRKEHV